MKGFQRKYLCLLQQQSCQQKQSAWCLHLDRTSYRDTGDTEAEGQSKMRLKTVCVTVLLAAALSYYIYTPLPDAIQEPWKLMAVDAAFRTGRNIVREDVLSASRNAWLSLILHFTIYIRCFGMLWKQLNFSPGFDNSISCTLICLRVAIKPHVMMSDIFCSLLLFQM